MLVIFPTFSVLMRVAELLAAASCPCLWCSSMFRCEWRHVGGRSFAVLLVAAGGHAIAVRDVQVTILPDLDREVGSLGTGGQACIAGGSLYAYDLNPAAGLDAGLSPRGHAAGGA